MTQTCPHPPRINRLTFRPLARWFAAGLTLTTCVVVMPTSSASAQSWSLLDDPGDTDRVDQRGSFSRPTRHTNANVQGSERPTLSEQAPARRGPNDSRWALVEPEALVRPQQTHLQLDRAYLDELSHVDSLSNAATGLYISGSVLTSIFGVPFVLSAAASAAAGRRSTSDGLDSFFMMVTGFPFLGGLILLAAGIICDVESGNARSELNTNYPQFAFDVAPVEGGAVASAAIRF